MDIKIKPIDSSYAVTIYKWKNDELIKEMALDYNYQTTLEEQTNDIERAIKSDYSEYNVIVLNDVIPIGYIRIDWMDDQKEMAWLRFALGAERGKGYAKKALAIYLKRLFKKGCKRVEGEVYVHNVASQNLMEKLGFIKEGLKRKAHFTGKEYADVIVYGLLEEDFNKE